MILSAKETVIYKDKLYYIYRKVNPDHIKDGKVNDVKELWHCDIVVKNKYQNNDQYLFLRCIDDAEVLEYLPKI